MSNTVSLDVIRETAARQRHTRRVAPIHRVARASALPTLAEQVDAHTSTPVDSFHRSLDNALGRTSSPTVTAPCSCGDAA